MNLKKIINLCFLLITASFLLPSINFGFIYSHGIAKGLLFILFFYCMYGLLTKRIKLKKGKLFFLFMIFFISQAVSIINVADLSLFVDRFKTILYLYLYFFIATCLLDDKKIRLKIIIVLIGCSIFNLLIKFFIFIEPSSAMLFLDKLLHPGNLELINMNINRGRIYFDSYDEISLPLIVYFVYFNKKLRAPLVLIAIGQIFISFVTNFRTNLIMILLSFFGSILMFIKKQNRIRNFIFQMVSIISVLIIMFLAYFFGSKLVGFSYVDRLVMTDELEDVSTIDIRIAKWQQAFDVGLSKPLFGTGLGNYNLYLPMYTKMNLFKGTNQEKNLSEGLLHPHNLIVFTFAETGLLGLLSLFAVFIYFIYFDYSLLKSNNILSKSLIISFWVLFSFSLFNPTLYLTYNILFWLLRILIHYEGTNRRSHVR